MREARDELMTTAGLEEITICDAEGERLGRVLDLAIEAQSGRLRYLLLAPAKQPDGQAANLAVGWDELRRSAGSDAFHLAPGHRPPPADAVLEQESGLLQARQLPDLPLQAADGERIGRLRELVLNARDGRLLYALLEDESGRRFPLPWALLAVDEATGRLGLGTERQRLRAAPGFEPGFEPDEPIDWQDRVWAERLHEHYGLQPYWTVRSSEGG